MSLSQKHPGLVLVPWFNVAEWKHVSLLISSEEISDWHEALERLRIWKVRTPLLSAGVEGALIILEALLVDINKLSDYELASIYSMSLLRFLNIICAATSEKQGTFYKAAKDSDIPKWLVNIRHDIAHGSNLPSKSLLLSSLQFCLNWLRQKYWNVQTDFMHDYCINETVPVSLREAILIYSVLNVTMFYGEEIIEDYNFRVYNKIVENNIEIFTKNNKKLLQNPQRLLEILLEFIKKGIDANNEYALEMLNYGLIQQELFLPILNYVNESTGEFEISEDFASIWSQLLNVMYETEILDKFILKLYMRDQNYVDSEAFLKLTSSWIKTIFAKLNRSQEDTDSLQYFPNARVKTDSFLYKNKNVMNYILNNPHRKSLQFLEQILKYYDQEPQYIDDVIGITKIYVGKEQSADTIVNGHIYTLEDLNDNAEIKSLPGATCLKNYQSARKWRRITEVSMFKNLPLGVLPGSKRDKNPFLNW